MIEYARRGNYFGSATAAAEDYPIALHDPTIDPHGHVVGQRDGRDASQFHARELPGLFRTSKGDPARTDAFADHVVHIEA